MKGGGVALKINACICMGTQDEVLLARHMDKDVLAIFAQGQIQGRQNRSHGVPFLKKLLL